ncbi:MAG: bifunctional MaoC family dehydratase N-terminal/OB-fold nucleic acid binding domain-containing protein [Acidimicrobiia bacterium]
MTDKHSFLAKLKEFEGREVGTQDGADEVNQAMIRHWVEAMGDQNPVYTEPDVAAKTVHGQVIAPAVMLQAWVMRGIAPRPSANPSAQDDLMALVESEGFTSVVATNCEQEYDRMLHLGDHLRNRTVIDSVSEEKATGLGVGHFITTRVEYETLDGEPVGRQMFRILKFRPGTGRQAAKAEPEQHDRPKRPRPAITLDNKFWFDAATEHRLVIQRCSGCGVLRHPPRPRCDKCGSYEWDAVEAGGRGTVYSFVVNHYPQVPAFDYPLAVGLIELEEGTRLVANIVGIEPADVTIGMSVEVEWVEHDPDLTLPAFHPAK